ncbi:MAG: SCO family protein [Burkholderiales bacterium]
MMPRLRQWLGTAIIACLLAACSGAQVWKTHDIAGLVPELAFALSDDQGRQVSAEDYRGKVTLLFFGYTHCADVCNTTLAQLAQTLRASGDGRDDARVLFVTVDPARDSTAVMHQYVQAFGPQFVGLRGERAAIDALARRYRVSYTLGEPDAHGNYEVTHGSAVFVFDRKGEARLVFTPKDAPDAMAQDLRRIIVEAGRGKG